MCVASSGRSDGLSWWLSLLWWHRRPEEDEFTFTADKWRVVSNSPFRDSAKVIEAYCLYADKLEIPFEVRFTGDGWSYPFVEYVPRDDDADVGRDAEDPSHQLPQPAIPPENRTRPLTKTEAAKYLGYALLKRPDMKVDSMMKQGRLHFERVPLDDKRFLFDKLQFPHASWLKIGPK